MVILVSDLCGYCTCLYSIYSLTLIVVQQNSAPYTWLCMSLVECGLVRISSFWLGFLFVLSFLSSCFSVLCLFTVNKVSVHKTPALSISIGLPCFCSFYHLVEKLVVYRQHLFRVDRILDAGLSPHYLHCPVSITPSLICCNHFHLFFIKADTKI